MKKCVYETHSPLETEEIGKRESGKAQGGEIYLLNGDLGVGKTVFTKGFAKGLGIKEDVVSPTFTIMQIYENGRLPLYHFDMYRIEDPDEAYEIGLEEYLYGNGVTLMEWPSNIESMLPEKAVTVTIEKNPEKGDDYRRITIESV